MPLYEYECQKCGNRFELIQGYDAAETQKCPKCGGKAARVLAPPAIQFKGSGWYVTDYAGKSASATSGTSSEGATALKSSSDGGEKSSEKKPKEAVKKEKKH